MSHPAYTYDTAAEWLGINPGQIRRLVKQRQITHVKMGRAVRFRQIDLDEYAAGLVRPLPPEK